MTASTGPGSRVPFLNLAAQYATLKEALRPAVERVLAGGSRSGLCGSSVRNASGSLARLPQGIPEEARPFVDAGEVDLLTFASSATVHNFAKLFGKECFQALSGSAVVAAIGPITGEALQEYGVKVSIQPENYTIPALAEAIIAYFRKITP